MKNVILGYYDVEGIGPDFVETDITGHGPTDYAKLDGEIARRHPGRAFKRTGSSVESRDENDPGFLEYTRGMTLRQFFPDDNDTPQLRVGTCHWHGQPADVYLRRHRSKGTVGITLKVGGVQAAVFSEQASSDRLVCELPSIIAGTLGLPATNLILRVRETTAL